MKFNFNPLVLITVIVLGITILSFTLLFIDTKDKANEMYVSYESALAEIENVHDNTWKKISQTSGVAKASREDYDKYLKSYVERGESYNQAQMVWITETLSQNNNAVYLKLIQVLENSRDEMSIANRKLNYVTSQYNEYITRTMNSFLLMFTNHNKKLEIKQITSTRSKEAVKSGVDDDVNLGF